MQLSDLEHVHSAKVRDLYAMPDGALLMVASDRMSAFDFILDTPIPDKGRLLTQLSLWWFERLADIVPNHVISTDVPDEVAGRAIVCERLDMVAVECVARGYLAGTGVSQYERAGEVSGVPLPPGLLDGSRLPEPIFTPTTKGLPGQHDEPMTYAEVEAQEGAQRARELRDLTLAIYRRGHEIAGERGIIFADTKVEIGIRPDGTLVLADEVLTPDSSRFWPADGWQPGRPQPSYDKQYVRDWLVHESGWDPASGAPPPPLPPQVVDATRQRYVEAYERLTGSRWR